MMEIKKILKELCPDGVKYVPFGSVATIVRGASPRPISSYITDDENGINWIKIGDVKPESKYITETKEKISQAGAEKSRLVKPGDFVLSNSMSFGRPYIMKIAGCIHDGWLAISDFEDVLIPDFLYYVLSSSAIQKDMAQKASNGTVQNLNAEIVRQIQVPLPPLVAQREIVRVLDNFTLYLQELTAELTARREQYEYYRDKLLSFSDLTKNGGGYSLSDSIRICELGELLLSLKTGLNPRTNFKLNTNGSTQPYITGKDIYNNKINVSDRTDKITQLAVDLINKRACLNVGDILFASTGTGTVGRMAIIDSYDFDWSISESIYAMKPNKEIVEPKYLMHVLYAKSAINQYTPKISKASVPHLKVADLLKVKLPIPSIEKQREIITVLDRFDDLCNDICKGLPTEINARKSQYEYYMNKLLTFEKIA